MAEDTFRKTYKTLTKEDQLALGAVKSTAEGFEVALKSFVHPGRELSLALTKLEECVMWAVKGITK